jgi:hypothetical protein
LREGYIQPRRNLHQLIEDSFPSFISIFKYVLMLLKQEVPKDNLQIIIELNKKIDFNIDIFSTILSHMAQKDLTSFFPEYLQELEKITAQVDRMGLG